MKVKTSRGWCTEQPRGEPRSALVKCPVQFHLVGAAESPWSQQLATYFSHHPGRALLTTGCATIPGSHDSVGSLPRTPLNWLFPSNTPTTLSTSPEMARQQLSADRKICRQHLRRGPATFCKGGSFLSLPGRDLQRCKSNARLFLPEYQCLRWKLFSLSHP